nr:radical SAM protein [Mycobacterium sp.]
MTVTSLGLPAVRQDAAAHPDGMPLGGPLVDTFGRVATDLRVSLTDRCNLRCTYCMPAEGLDWLPGDDLLTLDELTRLLTVAVTRLGITSVRFTGGEPLLYRRLEEVVAATIQDHMLVQEIEIDADLRL